jgi:multiple antibiotic resistance protein
MVGPGELFTLFFVMLGPLKLLGPFVKRTHGIDDRLVQRIALWAFVLATVSVVVGGLLGARLLGSWHISISSMTIAGGIVFLLVALRQLLEQFEPHAPDTAAETLPASPMLAATRLLFPIVLTPYGIAAVIAVMGASRNAARTEAILAIVLAIMVLNLLAMWFARRILIGPVMIGLQVLGAVLAVMQVALAIELLVTGLRSLGVIPA